jgi:hypothetical protein
MLWEDTREEIVVALAEFLTSGEIGDRTQGSLRLRMDGTIE